MDLCSNLEENKQRFDSGNINEDEYNERRKSILNKWKEDITTNKYGSSSHSRESDLYGVLQLTRSATIAEIKTNYRKLSLEYHPDKNCGTETEEWYRLSMAYKILSDENRRALYDRYGTINDGGDSWKPYIGDLENGFGLFSYVDDKSLPELKYITSTEQKERRHHIRISNIVNYLQDKLSRFPEQDNSSEFESFKQSLRLETLKLVEEPNGENLLSLLGSIYVSKAEAHLTGIYLFDRLNWIIKLIPTLSEIFGTGDEVTKVAWLFSKLEISSIARETCEKALNNKDYDNHRLADSLKILGGLWVQTSEQNSTFIWKNTNIKMFLALCLFIVPLMCDNFRNTY
ncbi:16200_t:CDS:2 [Funneliformis mosseae]|uniref:16200_t:CDS:1 n=1 Tax=Funneliformis mosseae TaxID=27381 RepID=A0A9N9EIX0_FUNMO|nr:16200_t:CDS:2 [Funneliformis mosseae]